MCVWMCACVYQAQELYCVVSGGLKNYLVKYTQNRITNAIWNGLFPSSIVCLLNSIRLAAHSVWEISIHIKRRYSLTLCAKCTLKKKRVAEPETLLFGESSMCGSRITWCAHIFQLFRFWSTWSVAFPNPMNILAPYAKIYMQRSRNPNEHTQLSANGQRHTHICYRHCEIVETLFRTI